MLIVRKRRYRLAHRFSTGFLALLMLMTQTVPPGGTLWATPPSGDPPPEFSVAEAAVVRRGVTLNGYGRIEGSLHQLQADTSVLNGNASVTGQYYAAGTPNVQVNGNPAFGGVVQGTGSTQPSGYKITINGSVSLPHLVNRTDPVPLVAVFPPPAPTGTRSVSLNNPGQSPGNFATLRDLSLNGTVGPVAVPPGTYGKFSGNGQSAFVLGVAGSTERAVYNLSELNLNGDSKLQLVGPVLLTIGKKVSINGSSRMGEPTNSQLLFARIYSGGLDVNGNGVFSGFLNTPSSPVVLNGSAIVWGHITCDKLTVNGSGVIKGGGAEAPPAVSWLMPGSGQVFSTSPIGAVLKLSDDVSGLDSSSLDIKLDGVSVRSQFPVLLNGSLNAELAAALIVSAPGPHTLLAQVKDLAGHTSSASVEFVLNGAPLANAGADLLVPAGNTAQLDGTGSTDPDGNALTYQWSFVSKPAGSGAVLSDLTSPTPTFVADRKGNYVVQLTVNDGSTASAPDTVMVTVQNRVPLAEAGADQNVFAGDTVPFDGTASSDPDGDPLAYQWTFASKPSGSNATFSDPLSPQPSFVPDVPGAYTIQLVVNDGEVDSAPSTLSVTAGVIVPPNHPPVADAGVDRTVDAGEVVSLDGTGSSDPDLDTLTYQWTLVSKPPGSSAVLSDSSIASPTFIADVAGSFVVELVVNDGHVGSAPDSVSVTAQQPPVPVVDLEPTEINANSAQINPVTLVLTGSVDVIVRNNGTTGVPGPYAILAFQDVNLDGAYTADTDQLLGQVQTAGGPAAGATAPQTIAVSGQMSFAGDPIHIFVDSTNATVETNEDNNIRSSTADCQTPPRPLGQFDPVVKWEWQGGVRSVYMHPVVVRARDTSGDGQINAGDVPTVFFTSYPRGALHPNNADGVLHAVRGDNGQELFSQASPPIHASSSLAAGDIDGDGLIEIVAVTKAGGIAVFEHDGTLKWNTPGIVALISSIKGQTYTIGNMILAPTIADLNHDGQSEIIVGPVVLTAAGAVLWQGQLGSGLGNNVHDGSDQAFIISTVADIDLDGFQEVICGNTVYKHDGTLLWKNSSVPDGFNAVGNFDADPYPEIALVSAGVIRLLDRLGNLIWTYSTPDTGRGGAPTIADFDADGQPEIGVALRNSYVVVETNGTPKWSQTLFTDLSSHVTGSSVFDFNGDGAFEVVCQDEFKFMILNGANGQVLYQIANTSGTALELPVIADINGDGTAEIIVKSDNDSPWGVQNSVRVFGDRNNTWVAARPIWNQHAYHITNVNDDGTIPQFEQPSWQVHNTYRCNLAENPLACVDLSASYVRIDSSPLTGAVTFTVRVGNAGALPVAPGVAVAFYDGDPSLSTLIGVAFTSAGMQSGEFKDVQLVWNSAPLGSHQIVAVADDDGAGQGSYAEENEDNNRVEVGFNVAGPNHAPLANAGTDQTVTVQTLVQVDGSGSSDPDNNPLTYRWSMLSKPQGSAAVLSSTNTVTTTFTPDIGSDEAEVSFASAVEHGEAFGSVEIVDLDQDGKLDLLIPMGNGLNFHRGQGDGSFLPPTLVGNHSGSLGIRDFNGDGKLDVAVSSNGLFSMMLGNGDGTLQQAVHDSASGNSGPFAIADYNGDGKLDVAVSTDTRPGSVTVRLGNGDATFQPPGSYPIVHSAKQPAAGDVNSDGKIDLLVVHGSDFFIGSSERGGLSVLLGNGDGTFAIPAAFMDTGGIAPGSLDVGDFNHDGKLDVATANVATNDISVLLGRGDGTFQLPLIYPIGTYPGLVKVADINRDQHLDLIVSITNSNGAGGFYGVGSVAVLLGNGDGTFAVATNFNLGTAPAGVALGDLNGDGAIDLAVAHHAFPPPSSHNVVVLLNQTGLYKLQLIVNDGYVDSAPDTVNIFARPISNELPIANAGPDRSVLVGTMVTLDGTGSSDPDNDTLTYQWTLTSKPAGSFASLSDPTVASPMFQADLTGAYTFSLVVNDGLMNSVIDSVVITAGFAPNTAPSVNAGPDQTVALVDTVELAGIVTDDGLPLGGQLTTTWSRISGPGSVAFGSTTSASTTATFSSPGTYVLRLSAHDTALGGSDDVTITVELACVEPPLGITAWWTGDGTANDQTGANHGTLRNGATFGTGRVGSAFKFDGSDDYIDVADHAALEFTNEMTFAAWIRPDNVTGPHVIFSKFGDPGNYAYDVNVQDGKLRADFSGDGSIYRDVYSPAGSISVGVWSHVVVTFESGTWRMFINGSEASTGTVPFASIFAGGNANPVMGGDGLASLNQDFQGLIDEVALYNRALDPLEINAIYQAGGLGQCKPGVNQPPVVDAGPDQALLFPAVASLAGSAADDDLPAGSTIVYAWAKVSGPGSVTFGNASAASTTATFSAAGTYVLRLMAGDGQLTGEDEITIAIPAPCTPQPSGLVAWWPAEGDAIDIVGTHHGIERDGVQYAPGMVGQAFNFNSSTGSFVEVPNFIRNYDKFTFTFWVNIRTFTHPYYMTPFSQATPASDTAYPPSEPIFVFFTSNGFPDIVGNFGMNGRWTDGTGFEMRNHIPFGTGVWKHIAVTYDGNSMRQYVDGALFNESQPLGYPFTDWPIEYVGKMIGNTQPLLFGKGTGHPAGPKVTTYYDGLLDEVQVYNRALTAPEVQSLFASGSSGICEDGRNRAPLPDAGPDQSVNAGWIVQLTGAGSSDPDNDPLTYQWTILNKPLGSNAALSNANALNPSFVADISGAYSIQLTVNDGHVALSDIVTITANNTPNTPPTARAGQDQTVPTGFTVILDGSGSDDPEDNPLTYQWALISKPQASQAFLSNPTTPTPSFFADVVGDYTFELTVNDGLASSAADSITIHITPVQGNRPPTITSIPPFTGVVGQPYVYDVDSSDPDGDLITYVLTQSPAGMTINSSSGLINWTPQAAGPFPVEVTGNDGRGGTIIQSWTITVNEPTTNQPPQFTSSPGTAANVGGTYTYDANAVDPEGQTIVFSLPLAPTGMTIVQNTGVVTWTPQAGQVGLNNVTVRAQDPQGALADQSFNINVTNVPDTVAPTIEMGAEPPQNPINVNQTVMIQVRATDNVGVTFLSLTVNGTPLTLSPHPTDPTIQQASFSSPTPGAFNFVATARDAAGNQTSDNLQVSVRDPADTTFPEVAITTPADKSELTGPVDIIGTASDAHFANYKLEISPLGANTFTTFATGIGSVTNGVLGNLDTTTLRNGFYEVRLTAEDINGQSSSVSVVYSVMGQLKIGNFAFSENDITIPVSGIPISVVRRYDSFNKGQFRDFGFGWDLAIDLDLKEGEDQRSNFFVTVGDPAYDAILDPDQQQALSVRVGGNRDVFVTLPDGRRARFKFVIRNSTTGDPEHVSGNPVKIGAFVAEPGVHAELIIKGNRRINEGGFGIGPFWEANPHTAGDLNFNILEFYEIPGYILRTQDGTEFHVDKTPSAQGSDRVIDINGIEDGINSFIKQFYNKVGKLTKIVDRNGNTLTIGPGGIVHSDGKSVLFTRDAQGRITSLTDPAGNAVVEYGYDAQGDLVTVTRLVDAATNKKVTTTYTYTQIGGVSTHNILKITSPTGKTPAINEYDDSGRLISTTDPSGRRIIFTHSLATRQEIVTDRRGFQTVYAYDERGNVTDITNALGETTHNEYDVSNRLSSQTIAYGSPLALTRNYEYDQQGSITRAHITADGNVIAGTISYVDVGGAHLPSVITDPRGTSAENTFDASGNLIETKIRDVNGNVLRSETQEYDTRGHPTLVLDPLGTRTESEYDASGNLTQVTIRDLNGTIVSKQTTSYDVAGNPISKTSWKSVSGSLVVFDSTVYSYDAQSRLVRVENALGGISQTLLDDDGTVLRSINESGVITEFAYDSFGRLEQTNYGVGTSLASHERIVYDENGNKKTAFDRAGSATNYIYDAVNRLVRTDYPDGSSVTTRYDAAGRVTDTTDGRGQVTRFGYDLAGRRTSITNALNQTSTATYDLNGNQVAFTDPLGRTVTSVFDPDNRLIRQVFPDGTDRTVTYDVAGRRIAESDQAGVTTRFSYDPLGRQVSVNDSLNQVTSNAYDELGNLIAQTDANGHTTTYEYDKLGRRIKRTLASGMSETFTYDAAGNILSRTDFNGKTTTYSYDLVNRLVQKSPDANLNHPPVTFTYTVTGQRSSMTDASGTTTYQYDNRDRLTQKATPQGTLAYTYDANGNIISIDSSNANGASLGYEYDELNRLKKAIDNNLGVTTYNYDAVGNLQDYTYPNGVKTSYNYNNLNRLTSMSVVAGVNQLASYTYTLGPTGNRTSVTELNSRTVSYGYDSLYRLTSETIANDSAGPNGSINYTHDAVGNRLTRTSSVSGVPSTTYSYDSNDRLTTDQYDNNGNTIGSNGNTDQYDFENKLIDRNNGQVQILYDGDGNRVRKTVAGVTTHYLVDNLNPTGYAQVLDELTSVGAGSPILTRTYAYGHDLISQDQLINNVWKTSFYCYDGNASVRALTDETGAITDTYTYDAFGIQLVISGTTLNSYRFAGEQYDPNLDFYYLRARYLNPSTGRFWTMDAYEGIQSDPISLHKYLYAHSNPVNRIDPSGNVDFSLPNILVTMGIGFAIGALCTVAANHALGRAQTISSIIEGGLWAAVLTPFAVLIPAVGIGLGIGGLMVAGLISWQVFTNPEATTSQKIAALALVVAGIWGTSRAISYYKYIRSFEPTATITINQAFLADIVPAYAVVRIRGHISRLAKEQGDTGDEIWWQPEWEMLNRFENGARDPETINWVRHEMIEIKLTEQAIQQNPGPYLAAQQVAHGRVIGHEMANGVQPANRYTSDIKAKYPEQFKEE